MVAGMQSTDDLLNQASAELRRYSRARTEREATDAYNALVRHALPGVGAVEPAYGKALTQALDYLIQERTARGCVPSI
jgi:hypothetical protein